MATYRACWNGAVIAESDETIVVEANHYFPPDAIKARYLRPSTHLSFCGWKGQASYYDLTVDGVMNPNAAWYYADPLPAARQIAGRIAFWHGVEVTEVNQ